MRAFPHHSPVNVGSGGVRYSDFRRGTPRVAEYRCAPVIPLGSDAPWGGKTSPVLISVILQPQGNAISGR